MTLQQARMTAMQLRAKRPELQNMAVEDLIAQVMASEGAPGAGGGLANLFPPKALTPSSPAPMMAARLAAPKPTAEIVPGLSTDSFRRAQQVRQRTDRGPTVGERDTANANRQALVAEMRAAPEARAPEAAAAAPVREASPVATALAAAGAPQKGRPSRFSLRLQQKQAQLEQLKAAVPASGETPDKLAYDLDILSREVNELENLVAAEEAATVDPERAAILERQTQRLGREEELVEQARKRAPFDALIAAGTALGSARPGESFTSALTRGLAAGSEKYTGARDAREEALRGVEERRDALALQSIDAVQKARDEAIALQNAGAAMTEQQIRLAGMTQEGATNLALAPFKLRVGKAEASKAETEAEYAPKQAAAELESTQALADYRRRPPAPRSGSGAPKPTGSVYSAIQSRINKISTLLSDPYTSAADKADLRAELAQKRTELAYYGGLLGINVPAPAAAPKAAPPVKGARLAPDGKYYVPDPKRQGKWLQVTR